MTSIIAIVGENGAGKTTLVKLLLRLYDVSEGSVLINGRKIQDYSVHELRQPIGVAPQAPNAYVISLAENAQLFNRADEQAINTVIDTVGLRKSLVKTGASINTDVTKEFDSEGIEFSGGELQKLALARIMINKFNLLILDEPSSALDPIAEHDLVQLIYNRANTTTTIMIAHRLSTIRDADRIYVMDNGTIIESGSHNELMELRGKYCEMFMKQSENYVK